MSYEKISCRIAVQICVGHFPNGRKKHRTFSLRNIHPDVSLETIADIIRALTPLLAHPITMVTKVVTKRSIIFDKDAGAALPVPQVNVGPVPEARQTQARRIIPFPVFPVTEHPAAHRASGYDIAESSSCASLRQKGFFSGRAPPARSHPGEQMTNSSF